MKIYRKTLVNRKNGKHCLSDKINEIDWKKARDIGYQYRREKLVNRWKNKNWLLGKKQNKD